jgi:hypothetical protein
MTRKLNDSSVRRFCTPGRLCTAGRSMVLALVFLVGCASTPDESGADGQVDGDGGTGGVMHATGGAAPGSGGFEAGGSEEGGSGGTLGSQSGGANSTGGAANTGGALPSGGTTSTGGEASASGGGGPGGAEGTGGATSTGGAEGTGGCTSQGEITFVPTFDESVDDSFRAGLATCVERAGELWSELLVVPFDVTLEVLVAYEPSISTANCRSTTTAAWDAANDIYEVSAAYEIRTGEDPNGAAVDIEMNFGTSLTNGTYWFDPDPSQRTADIPSGKIDVLSTCSHELGHALAFSGARDSSTGELPGYSFLYDEYSTRVGDYFYFTGTLAEAAYGSEVPLNVQILDHLGNVSPAPGDDLDLDLMHGTPTRYQQRYYPTDVDAGILADLGLPVVGTPAADAVCSASHVRAKTSVKKALGPTPSFVE